MTGYRKIVAMRYARWGSSQHMMANKAALNADTSIGLTTVVQVNAADRQASTRCGRSEFTKAVVGCEWHRPVSRRLAEASWNRASSLPSAGRPKPAQDRSQRDHYLLCL